MAACRVAALWVQVGQEVLETAVQPAEEPAALEPQELGEQGPVAQEPAAQELVAQELVAQELVAQELVALPQPVHSGCRGLR